MSRVSLQRWENRTEEQRSWVRDRRAADIVRTGATLSEPLRPGQVFVVVEKTQGSLVGVLRWSPPLYRADAAWWIDPEWRRCGYATEAVRLLAEEMNQQGVTGVHVRIDGTGENYYASVKLRRCFESHFGER